MMPDPTAACGADKRATVLIVDDEPEILTALQDLLEDEYAVLTSTSPLAALDLLQTAQDVAVIVSDQRMPHMTGDVFLARAREISRAEGLLLTGYADLSAVVGAVNNGRIAGYAHKPWEPAALRSMIGNAVARHRLAQALETEHALLHGLLDHAADALCFKDAQGRFVRLNAAKAEALGVDPAECPGRRESEFLPDDQADELEQAERAVAAERQPAERLEERRGAEGATRWFQVSRTPILDAQGRVSHIAVVERDVTEYRQMEARLRQAEKMQALGTMAGGVAHDFNNLLAAILGSLELAARLDIAHPRLQHLLSNASQAAKRGSALTQRLLSFSRQRDLAVRTVDANAVVRGMEDLLTRTLGSMIRVERRLAPDLWPVLADPDELELALLNLAINARDAMPKGGTLAITTRNAQVEAEDSADLSDGDYVTIAVRDSGMGMPPDVLNRVFEPFFTTKEVGKGTGLGLSMVYGFAKRSGGAVRIESNPGEGTLVKMLLARNGETVANEVQPAECQPAPQRPLRILVVDDDPAVREVTVGFLVTLGHSPVEARNGPDAIALAHAHQALDLMIADFTMPAMSGLDLAKQVRSIRPGLPVLLVTGHADWETPPPDVAVLYKPFDSAQLANAISTTRGGGKSDTIAAATHDAARQEATPRRMESAHGKDACVKG